MVTAKALRVTSSMAIMGIHSESLAVGLLEEHRAGDEGQGAEQLVGRAEQARCWNSQLGQGEGQGQGSQGGHVLIGEEAAHRAHLGLEIGLEELLEGQPASTRATLSRR